MVISYYFALKQKKALLYEVLLKYSDSHFNVFEITKYTI